MRALALQLSPGTDKAANIAMVRAALDTALGAQGEGVCDADMIAPGQLLVSLPEMWTCLGGDRATKLQESEVLPEPGEPPVPDSAYAFLRNIARTRGLIVHGGSIGERDGDRLFNTTLLFGPDGTEIARYRKMHMFDIVTPSGQGYRESAMFGAGERVVTAAASGFCFGLSICYDVRFAELYIALRKAGAGVIFVPSAFTAETGRDHWEVLLRARAIETQCYVIAAATCGAHPDAAGRPRQTFGHSMICGPWGEVLAQCATEPGFIHATLDARSLTSVREAMPVLAHRRLV